jgi:hypothetical protein
MSNRARQRLHALIIKKDLDDSIERLSSWIREASSANSASPYVDANRYERLAWHYGYLIALRDVRERLKLA